MLQTCQKCGNDSPTGDKYCRQCGEPFVVETVASGAATRNYIKQEPPSVANAGSEYFPPSVADAIVGDTERYYQAPMPAAPAQFTSQFRPKFWRWRWGWWILSLLLTAMIVSMMTVAIVRRPGRMPAPPGQPIRTTQAEREAQRREQNRRREWQERIRDTRHRADEAQERSRRAVEQLLEASERAREAGTEIRPTGEKLLDLSKYEYPNTTSGTSNRIPGYETLTMRTSDNFDTVKLFYEKMLGQPVVFFNEPFEKWVIFQSDKDPLISVYLESEFEGQVRIVGLRFPFRIVPIEDALNKR
jgi:hypothetical protein